MSEEKKENVENAESYNDLELSQPNLSEDDDGKESTRSVIAIHYIYGFFIIIAITFIIGYNKDFTIDMYCDFLITISGILSGPLGFIIGYYFKAGEK